MKKFFLVLTLIIILISSPVLLKGSSDFDRGVAYLLLNDPSYAKISFLKYFNDNYNPIVKSGFSFLVKGNLNEAKKEFNRYLNMNFRSTQALVGISITVSDMSQSTSIENLEKCIKLDPKFSSAYAALGIEFQKRENYPKAEKYFLLAIKYGRVAEYKILLGNLYLFLKKSRKTLALIQNEVNLSPDNFQINFLMAKTLYSLNRISDMSKFINISLELNGNRSEVQLWYAKFLYKESKYKQAKTVLKNLRPSEANYKGYIKLYAKTLNKIGDRKAKVFLYQFFSKYPWDRDVNYLIGEYYLKNKNEKSNIQNWIFRAILSGNSQSKLKGIFSDEYIYPKIDKIGFFKVHDLYWLDNSKILICASMRSGEDEKIFIVDSEKNRIIRNFSFPGKYKKMFISNDSKKIIIISSTFRGIYAFGMEKTVKSWSFFKISRGKFPIEDVQVNFNSSGSLAYIVEGNIDKLSFESPFSRVNRFGEKSPVYPGFGFKVYRYNFLRKKLSYLTDISEIEKIPSSLIKKYFMVLHAYNTTSEVTALIEKGEKFDVISSDIVKIIFSENLDSFAIYLADLDNAFQAVIFNNDTGKITQVDETMFLDSGRFAELTILRFDSVKNRFIFSTRDKRKNLIIFNYKTKLYRSIAENFFSACFNKEFGYIYILSERDKKFSFIETMLQVANINNFWIDEVSSRRDIRKIESCEDILNLKVQTNSGEILLMDYNNKFSYLSPSYEGTKYSYSPNSRKAAVFCNGNLYFFDNYRIWGKEQNLKK